MEPPPPPPGGLHRIGNRGLREYLLLHRRTGAVFGVQNGALVGEQGLFCLFIRKRFFALQILHTVSAGGSFVLGQLDGIGQLDRREVGDVLVDGPDEAIRSRIVQHHETAVGFVQFFGIIAEIGHVAVRLGLQLRAADGQFQRAGDKVERGAHLVLHRGTGTNGVEDLLAEYRRN